MTLRCIVWWETWLVVEREAAYCYVLAEDYYHRGGEDAYLGRKRIHPDTPGVLRPRWGVLQALVEN